ncbi:hypothetical protein BU17DRAFT_74828 [Hysterangium stoloniferum]|nr:hypothetical protein BU17DRAFT_74828 [Hysterangium stoloniferum]
MTSTLSNWYHHQYSLWNRTRRMQASPFLARGDAEAGARIAAANAQPPPDTIINMGDLLSPPTPNDRTPGGDNKKKQDTLFGPSIGVVNPGPQWADQGGEKGEKSQMQDALTPELVKSWVERSKEASQPTTTLQALVNLKRPSLRLSPISHDIPETSENPQPHQHGLEFQFDCDAPKCGISLHVIIFPSGKDASSSNPTQLVNVFQTVVDGGFGRTLKLEDGATLELDKYDPSAQTAALESTPADPSTAPKGGPTPPTAEQTPAETAPNHKKRFTLRIRKRTHPHAPEDSTHMSVAGPALQVVDLETPGDGTHGAKEKDEEGVKVLIKLEALDANEHGLASPNSQTTYLHIVRLGLPAPSSSDTRPWVVRVVKREATIGPHTFHLHEIYGLTSHTSAAPTTTETHVYPPNAAIDTDDPTSECLLCLSSPREVVLLPCRHLVACKECAVNMVEFGAGGQLVHADEAPAETPAAAPAGEAPAEGSGAPGEDSAAPSTPAPQPAAAPRTTARRKRKAKGWFCPVCRQPYTSLLRISTTAPVAALAKAKDFDNEDAAAAEPPVAPQRSGIMLAISNAAARVTGSEANNTTSAGQETPRETV